MKPVIGWELRQRRTTVFWWSVGVFVLTAILFLIYPSIHDQAETLNKTINSVPSGIKALKDGGTSGLADIASTIGFLNSQVYYITLPIIYIIYAITRGSNLIGREEQDRTLELLLSRPISRGRLLLAKATSGLIELLIIASVATVTSVILAGRVNMDISVKDLIVINAMTLLFCLSFGALSFALVAYGRFTKRLSSVIAFVIAFGGWLITSLQGVTHYLEAPAKFAPYHYFLPADIMNGHIANGLWFYLVGIFVITAAVSYLGFARRDI